MTGYFVLFMCIKCNCSSVTLTLRWYTKIDRWIQQVFYHAPIFAPHNDNNYGKGKPSSVLYHNICQSFSDSHHINQMHVLKILKENLVDFEIFLKSTIKIWEFVYLDFIVVYLQNNTVCCAHSIICFKVSSIVRFAKTTVHCGKITVCFPNTYVGCVLDHWSRYV
jgi:hypothetical protein